MASPPASRPSSNEGATRGRPRTLGATKKPPSFDGGFRLKPLAVSYSCMANAKLPSALVRFTSEFGMGSGGTTPLWRSEERRVGKECRCRWSWEHEENKGD